MRSVIKQFGYLLNLQPIPHLEKGRESMANYTKVQLDIPFCGLHEGVENKETIREFIRNTEKEFGRDTADLENMSEDELNHYIEFLDYLWEK